MAFRDSETAWSVVGRSTSTLQQRQALEFLHSNRHTLSSISNQQAASLLCVLQRDVQQAEELTQRLQLWPPALHLLSRWAVLLRQGPADDSSTHQLLDEVVRCVLCEPLSRAPVTAVVAAVQFLGSAYPGCSAASRAAVPAVLCDVLCGLSSSQLLEGEALCQQLCGGVRDVMVGCLQVSSNQVGWLLACLLRLLSVTAATAAAAASPARTVATAPHDSTVAPLLKCLPDDRTALGDRRLLDIHRRMANHAALEVLLNAHAVLHHLAGAAVQLLAGGGSSGGPGASGGGGTPRAAPGASGGGGSHGGVGSALMHVAQIVGMGDALDIDGSAGAGLHMLPAISLLCAAGLLEGAAARSRQLPPAARDADALPLDMRSALQLAAHTTRRGLTTPLASCDTQQRREHPIRVPSIHTTASQPVSEVYELCQGYAFARLMTAPVTLAPIMPVIQTCWTQGHRHGRAVGQAAERADRQGHAGWSDATHLLPVATLRLVFVCCLPLDGVFATALGGGATCTANTWLTQHSQRPLFQDVGTIVRPVLDAVSASSPTPSSTPASPSSTAVPPWDPAGWTAAQRDELRHALLLELADSCTALAERYSMLVIQAPPGWMAALDRQRVRDVLDRTFVVAVSLLSTLFSAWTAHTSFAVTSSDEAAAMAAHHDDGHAAQHLQWYIKRLTGVEDVRDCLRDTSSSSSPSPIAPNAPSHDVSAVPVGSPCVEQPSSTVRPALLALLGTHTSFHSRNIGVQCPRALAAVGMLRVIMDLQFCSLQLTPYSTLLRQVIAEVVGDPIACDAALRLLPPPPQDGHLGSPSVWPHLHSSGQQVEAGRNRDSLASVLPSPSEGATGNSPAVDALAGRQSSSPPAGQPTSGTGGTSVGGRRWVSTDVVMLAKVTFLLPVAALCVPNCRAPAAALGDVLPLALSLLQHSQDAPVKAAHTCIGSMLATLAAKGHEREVLQALPLYASHALGDLSSATPAQVDGLALGLQLVLPVLPAGSAAVLTVSRQLVDQCWQWLRSAVTVASTSSAQGVATGASTAKAGPNGGQVLADGARASAAASPSLLSTATATAARGGDLHPAGGSAPTVVLSSERPSDPGASASATSHKTPDAALPTADRLALAAKLVELVCSLVIVVDYNVLPQVAGLVGSLLRTAPEQVRVSLLQYMHDAVLRCNDYARKTRLMQWFHGLVPKEAVFELV